MRSYRINTNRLVNELVPHYIGGRKLILLLQSWLRPLDTLNQKWKEWADDKRIEASMTSQVIMLEYFLNRKYRKYFTSPSQHIVISDGEVNGVPLYWADNSSAGKSDMVLYNASEGKVSKALHWKDEKQPTSECSFIVNCPSIDTTQITQEELTGMISYWVHKYSISGKKFKVIYE